MRKSLERRHGRSHLVRRLTERREAGMVSAEYAVGTLVACAFAAVLLAVVNSGGISGLIVDVISAALSALF